MGFWGITHLVHRCKWEVNKILKEGISQKSLTNIYKIADKYADRIDKKIDWLSKSWWGKKIIDKYYTDDTDIAMKVQTYGKAEGRDTVADTNVEAVLLKGEGFSIGMGVAHSVALAEGGIESATAATWSQVVGTDIAVTQTLNIQGQNIQKSSHALVTIDFHKITDGNFWFGRDKNIVADQLRAEIDGGGNVATASAKVYVASDAGQAYAATATLAVEATLSDSQAMGLLSLG